MRQALTPTCLIFFWSDFPAEPASAATPSHMLREPGKTAVASLSFLLLISTLSVTAQQPKAVHPAATGVGLTATQAVELAEQGRCKEAVPALKRVMNSKGPSDIRKNAGVLGLRCSFALQNDDAAMEFARLLGQQFPEDPDVLFVLVHAYSDLSTHVAQQLGRTAPQSIAAHKLNAEALEMQGKWGEAEREYEDLIEKHPNTPGLHFLLGRLLLSRPDADAASAERARQEFMKELEIDPNNAGAAYILGEMARKDENWDEAIARFSQAAKLDPNFADAFLGWGSCLVTVKRYAEAIAPLLAAERLMAWNPAVHYTLATALSRSGHKEEAEKEFEIHRTLTSKAPPPQAGDKPQ
jgi:tetratricopeptide (TPR) repeat protein